MGCGCRSAVGSCCRPICFPVTGPLSLVCIRAPGRLWDQAVEVVTTFSADSYEGVIAEPAWLRFHHSLGQVPSQNLDKDEEAFVMAMIKSWEERKAEARAEARAEGRAEGSAEGRAEARARDIITVLRVRGMDVPDVVRDRILAQRDLEQLERWLEKAAVASSVAEVLDEPS